MLYTVAQPLALVVDPKIVFGAFVGLVTLDCTDSPKRYTRTNKMINAEQYCLFQRLCSLKFTRLIAFQTHFVAANSLDIADQFIWAQMTVGKSGFIGCNKLPILNIVEDLDNFIKPYTYLVHEVGQPDNCKTCLIKYPDASFAAATCSEGTIPADHIKSYCDTLEARSFNDRQKTPRTIFVGDKMSDETHYVLPYTVDINTPTSSFTAQIVGVKTSLVSYMEELLSGSVADYARCLVGAENDKLESIAFKHGGSPLGYCLAIYAQTSVLAIPLLSRAVFTINVQNLLLVENLDD